MMESTKVARIFRRGWSLSDYQGAVAHYPSRLKLRRTDSGLYRSFNYAFPGELDKIFPPRVVLKRAEDEASVRFEASKYSSRKEFADYDIDMYTAALRLGISGDLGFPPSTGFDDTKPAQLYVGSVQLNDGTQGSMLGITTRHIYSRFGSDDVSRLSDTWSFRFDRGGDARKLESHLKKLFRPFAVKSGLSPLRDKGGTSGEVLSGVPVQAIVDAVRTYSEDIPAPVAWPPYTPTGFLPVFSRTPI